ncbi:hypothetical protein LX36DRAFT_662607, partial [Colletotrichum falcatum]
MPRTQGFSSPMPIPSQPLICLLSTSPTTCLLTTPPSPTPLSSSKQGDFSSPPPVPFAPS